MALTDVQRGDLRRLYYKIRGEALLPYTKIDLNAVFDADETRYQADRATWIADMEAAAPGVFDATEKKRMVAAYFWLRFQEDFV